MRRGRRERAGRERRGESERLYPLAMEPAMGEGGGFERFHLFSDRHCLSRFGSLFAQAGPGLGLDRGWGFLGEGWKGEGEA